MTERKRLIEILNKYFEIGDSDFYICNRVKEAFSLGTMSLDDFSEIDEEITADIADYLLAHNVMVPICNVGDTLYYNIITVSDFYSVTECTVDAIQMHTNGKQIYYVSSNSSKEKNRIFKEDIGRIAFFSKEEADKALERILVGQ